MVFSLFVLFNLVKLRDHLFRMSFYLFIQLPFYVFIALCSFILYQSSYQIMMNKNGVSSSQTVARRFFAGCLSGATCAIATYPLDLVRTRLACQSKKHPIYKGIIDCMHKVFAQEGIAGLYVIKLSIGDRGGGKRK